MRSFWTKKEIPELATLLPAERAASWKRIYRKTFRHWETWMSLLFCAGLVAAGYYIGRVFAIPYVPMIIRAALGGLVSWEVRIYVARRYYKDDISRKLD
ncbi:hypothetical protein [Herbaspirillum sp. 1130]|uniref:hypothetical protein n=1 Tax=Herbaspirillum sp. 1130 TaxID=2806562 RepID=UPI001AE9803F|nr:hypothetical protein [Herbaspirillum sp. 1130]MBP1318331.1 Ni,Fe-hydrogenase I cytochrome b subunit [Herbaspirillum sp. 1130]